MRSVLLLNEKRESLTEMNLECFDHRCIDGVSDGQADSSDQLRSRGPQIDLLVSHTASFGNGQPVLAARDIGQLNIDRVLANHLSQRLIFLKDRAIDRHRTLVEHQKMNERIIGDQMLARENGGAIARANEITQFFVALSVERRNETGSVGREIEHQQAVATDRLMIDLDQFGQRTKRDVFPLEESHSFVHSREIRCSNPKPSIVLLQSCITFAGTEDGTVRISSPIIGARGPVRVRCNTHLRSNPPSRIGRQSVSIEGNGLRLKFSQESSDGILQAFRVSKAMGQTSE